MLNPQFKLRIDAVDKTHAGAADLYIKKGEYELEFDRDKNGRIVQNKLIDRDGSSKRPDNLLNDKTYLISAFSDIQNSEKLKDLPYLVLFNPLIKRNSIPKSDPGIYNTLPNDDITETVGNSVILHLTSSEVNSIDFTNLSSPDEYINSVFGPRNPAKILVEIYVNGISRKVQLNTRLKSINSGFPSHIKFYRKFGFKYKRVKGDISEIILLPNDQIKFKL